MDSRVERILIAAPYSALYGWEETIKAEGSSNLAYITGTPEIRRALIRSGFKWNLINKEGHITVPEIANIRWDAVILDESTFVKNPTAGISKFWVDNFREVPIRGVMTGTPAPESELEYFQQLKFVDPDILGYSNYYHFRNDWFIQPERSYEWFLKYAGRGFLERKLKGKCFILKRSDVRGEEKTYIVRKVSMPKKIREAYRRAENDFVLSLPGVEDQETIWRMTQYIWLRNIASGIVQDKLFDDFKINEMYNFMRDQMGGLRSIIWCAYTQEQEAVCKFLRDNGMKVDVINGKRTHKVRERIRREFMKGKLHHVIAQPSCFRHGTDLSGADYLQYFSRPTGLETSQQSEDRIINMAIDDRRDIVDWITEDTVDWSIYRGLRRKENRSNLMLRIIQESQIRCASASGRKN